MDKIPLTGEELIRRILDGERDFSEIVLKRGFNFSQYDVTQEFYRFMLKQDFSREPLDFSNSDFFRIDFRYSRPSGLNLSYSYCKNANFTGSNLVKVNFNNANLEEAFFFDADLSYSDLKFSNLRDANFWDSRLCHTDFRDVIGLEKAKNIETCYFHSPVIVTQKEKDIIEKFLMGKRLFNVIGSLGDMGLFDY